MTKDSTPDLERLRQVARGDIKAFQIGEIQGWARMLLDCYRQLEEKESLISLLTEPGTVPVQEIRQRLAVIRETALDLPPEHLHCVKSVKGLLDQLHSLLNCVAGRDQQLIELAPRSRMIDRIVDPQSAPSLN